ncbi:MAG TPA: TRAP transporter fused permease subunit [Bacillota bacterium]|nr:TRAP transporter fused permease subunit [Bacillota bacterium]
MNLTEEKVQNYYKTLASIMAVIVGSFHLLYVSGVLVVSSMPLRVIHLMFMTSIAILVRLKTKHNTPLTLTLRGIGVLLSCAVGIYILTRWQAIIESGGVTTSIDTYFGIAIVALILVITWKSIGKVLSAIVTLFLLYPFVGPYMPGILENRAYSLNRTFSFLFASTQGIYGIPISVAASYIVIFCIYGAFLSKFGAGDFLFKFSSALTSKLTAATAKTSIIFSALVGMISGSAAGNVAIAGAISIPMMKKRGYSAVKAGAVQAVAATGGQIMPPVMGAAAFLMVELTGVPYSGIMKAAIIPALLYFLSIFFIVHFTSLKDRVDLKDESREVYVLSEVLKEGWYLALPIIALIYFLITGFSPFKAAYYSTIMLIVVYVIANIISEKKVTYNFVKDLISKILGSIEKGAYDTVPISIACAASGLIVGVITMTGIGAKLTNLIIAASNDVMLLAMIYTMIISIILGMGLPTTAVYLIVASVVAPALVKMGMPLLTAHLYVFFFGCISTITPPVALASYVSAGIADADINKVGWTAFKYGLISFILPYMFVYGPALLLQGSVVEVITSVLVSIVGVYVLSISIVGYFKSNINTVYRAILFVGGFLLVNQGYVTDIIGFILIGFVFYMIRKNKRMDVSTGE